MSWSENPHHRQNFSDDIFRRLFLRLFFPAIFSNTDHIIRSAKRKFATFLKAPEPKTDPHTVFLLRPESHTPAREGAWPTFWCQASTNRLVLRRLALLSLRQSSPNPASPFFFGISASAGLLSASDDLWRQLPSLVETCVCLGKASSSSPVTSLLFGSRHTRFFFHSCDPTSL